MKITKTIKKQIDKHALKCYPNECCGLIVNGKFVAVENVHTNPTQQFRISPFDYASALLTGELEAIIHSHCYNPNERQKYDPRWASTNDMETWLATNVVWGIVATNGVEVSDVLLYDDKNIPPLTEREFVHGLYDCYSIVRDYYRTVLNIELINHPRGMGWWDDGKNLYDENFARAGFYVISEEEADVNDICLFQVRSPVINHAAVITGNNIILHHLFHRLSEYDRLDRWRKSIVKYLRYDEKLNTLLQGRLENVEDV